jgi:hypothetical protein
MIIIGGHKAISTGEGLFFGENVDISTSKDLICRNFDKNRLAEYKELASQKVPLLFHVVDIRDLVYACIIGARYVAVIKEDAPIMQKIVNDYLYDTKVLALIDDEDDIEWVATHGIDGALYTPEEFEL